MKKLRVEYLPNDNTIVKVCDGNVFNYVKKYCKKVNNIDNSTDSKLSILLLTSQESVIYAFRLAVSDGLISPDDIEFSFTVPVPNLHVPNTHIIEVDNYGHCSEYPDGFADFIDKINMKFLDNMFEDKIEMVYEEQS